MIQYPGNLSRSRFPKVLWSSTSLYGERSSRSSVSYDHLFIWKGPSSISPNERVIPSRSTGNLNTHLPPRTECFIQSATASHKYRVSNPGELTSRSWNQTTSMDIDYRNILKYLVKHRKPTRLNSGFHIRHCLHHWIQVLPLHQCTKTPREFASTPRCLRGFGIRDQKHHP